jgi:hypothetical protein
LKRAFSFLPILDKNSKEKMDPRLGRKRKKEKRKRGNESYEKTAIFFHFLPFSFARAR